MSHYQLNYVAEMCWI